MKIILAGAEYVGTTTFADGINDWKIEQMGEGFSLIHDHFKLPHTSGHPDDTTSEEQLEILNLSPKLKEMYTRYSIYYHVFHYRQFDDLTVGLHIEEGIYGPLYFDYGASSQPFDRNTVFEQVETRIKGLTDDPVIIVHMTATPEVILKRMKEAPHENGVLKEKDIDLVLQKFEDGVERSELGPKLHIDTSEMSVEDCIAEFASQIEPHLTPFDRERIEAHKN